MKQICIISKNGKDTGGRLILGNLTKTELSNISPQILLKPGKYELLAEEFIEEK